MQDIVVKVKSLDSLFIPEYATDGAAGADLKSAEDGVIKPGEVKLVKTGLFLEIPEGYEGQVRPRSGLALKFGVTVLNSPGTIDSDYRGEVGVILVNHSNKDFSYKKGDRIAQLVFSKVTKAKFESVEQVNSTSRGAGGFGHTGV
ncbi:dUTP diphosphatase [Deferribacterales bacterium Es71-Z0220]|uniref:dUTP diphosphatase n=1 Tax=Deferrivibrio essentukiensis TaxID=2880922 RepID=UPI001F614993|nr:dUTP diphosphatase [Deferrivibrio essentukiensis]MCB4203580.1 dUTP diphosphatase [Deferrivibrio essentukiensis]